MGFNLLISVFLSLNLKVPHEKDNGSQNISKVGAHEIPRKRHFCVLRCYLQTLLLFDLAHTQLQFNNFHLQKPFPSSGIMKEQSNHTEVMVPAPGNSQFSMLLLEKNNHEVMKNDINTGDDYFTFPENVISDLQSVRHSHP